MNENHGVQCQLLGSMSLDSVRSGPSYIHRCCAFPFALARLFWFSFGSMIASDFKQDFNS